MVVKGGPIVVSVAKINMRTKLCLDIEVFVAIFVRIRVRGQAFQWL